MIDSMYVVYLDSGAPHGGVPLPGHPHAGGPAPGTGHGGLLLRWYVTRSFMIELNPIYLLTRPSAVCPATAVTATARVTATTTTMACRLRMTRKVLLGCPSLETVF